MDPRRTAALAGTLTLLAVLPGACSSNGPAGPGPEDVAAARARWAEVGLTDYDMVQEALCFCPPPREWINHVRAGVVADVTVPSAASLPPAEAAAVHTSALALARSVPDALDFLEAALATAETVTFEFGPTGAPSLISVDGSSAIADDEITLRFGEPTGPAAPPEREAR
ncbi:DUF6174 domain-containing protein [bacterium]|nr:DUF6174 domain-containing protein [bacterium]